MTFIQDSIVLITSTDSKNSRFGSGFIIHKSRAGTFILTCAHVVRDVGGVDKALVNGLPASIASSGDEKGIDLAVLKVEGLWQNLPLSLKGGGKAGKAITTQGFQKFDDGCMSRPLKGVLGHQVALQARQLNNRVTAWDLKILDDYALKPGYSGSPVIDEDSGEVLGIVSHRQGEGDYGVAVSIQVLDEIWQMVDAQRIYRLLLKLGYQQQVRLFRRLVDTHDIAALLIYGEPEYGQRWLLNRLITQYLPNSLTGRIVKIDLDRRTRRSDVKSLWRELARRVGLQGNAAVDDIIQCIYRSWKTQNVLLILNDVNCLPQSNFQELIQEFWLPLSTKAKQNVEESEFKLLLFFVDYDGCVGEWDTPFIEKLDASWEPKLPVRSPRLEEFSDNDLKSWIDNVFENLPSELQTNEEVIIQEILDASEDGIPELVLQEICDRCGVDWYEEISSWLKL